MKLKPTIKNKYFLASVFIVGLFLVYVFFFSSLNVENGDSASIENSDSNNQGEQMGTQPVSETDGQTGTDSVISTFTPELELNSNPKTEAEAISSVSEIPVTERFIIPTAATTTENVADLLFEQGFIKNKTDFTLAFSAKGGEVTPGGYKLSKEASVLQVVDVLYEKPYLRWVMIPPGLRKEEIASLLAKTLDWSATEKQKWITTDTTTKSDYFEGTYFPDSYLIPADESPLNVANRIISKFDEKFAPYLSQFNSQNIKWTTGLTFASIVQREAANSEDMPLIAGILWNRLNTGMPLQVDATLQYVRGDVGNGWWAPISVADKQLVSPYNTYKNKGLPPHPISNPGIAAIKATLSPMETDCLYYLHDRERVTHCAVTYEEHLANIENYLKQ